MLRRIVLRYDPIEDRLVVCLVADQFEHWLHLTRRLAAQWRRDLDAVIERSAQAPTRLDPGARATVVRAHHQAMVAQAHMRAQTAQEDTPAASARPIPELAVGVACGLNRDDGRWLVRFAFAQNRFCTVALSPESMHGLIDLLDTQLHKAGWASQPPTPGAAHKHPSASPLH